MTASAKNWLPRLAALGAALLGVFLLLGAWGHLQAVAQAVWSDGIEPTPRRWTLILPAAILATAGLVNLAASKPLWSGSGPSLYAALAGNGLTLAYLLFLLVTGVPGHPVGLFTSLVVCEFLVLVAVRAGLRWPAQQSPA
ncbi:hypothetical protein F3N42_14875 [Marinihelvus fidelis]|uniref:Uncharacterized protein n=1 Tax=Marinihelvus fidelis TaxID=2613842 RepID=A0A5N0T3K0_9GAMM|nr:hypothetical protein [Marinihelvus fidelis]KAA9129645.1 hypothetical protein F3N42_14875 [Marinihelvus fidelis]